MKYLIIFTISILSSAMNLNNSTNELIGKWKCYHKELEDGTTKNTDFFSGEEIEYSCDGLILDLKPDFTGSESIGGLNFKYIRKDSILSLGNRSYIIEKLTENELVFRDFDSDGTNLYNYRRKFKKID